MPLSTQAMIVSVTVCSVRPEPFIFRIRDWRAANRGCGIASCLGCSSAVIAIFLVAFLIVKLQQDRAVDWREGLGWFGIVVVALLLTGSLLLYLYRSAQARSASAVAATLEARARFSDIRGHASTIQHHHMLADQALRRAHVALEEKQYGGFWESIEEATKALDMCQNSQALIAVNIERYVTALDNRTHDFPQWHAGLKPLQDLAPLTGELSKLKKKGDSSYEFASIRELRATRHEIVRSITELGEAIRHLEGAVTSSLNDLRRAVNRSTLLRAADPAQLRVVVGFLFSDSAEGEQVGG